MTHTTTNEIWVFGDLRTRPLLELSLKVLIKAACLARKTGGRAVMFLLTPTAASVLSVPEDETCVIQTSAEDEAIAWGAEVVYLYENERFSAPSAHLFAQALIPVFKEKAPRLVLFPLTDFGRDLAARTAAAARAGLMADCVELKLGEDGAIVGLCPAWGGEVMSEITYTANHSTAFATVQPQGTTGEKDTRRKGRIIRSALVDIPEAKGIRMLSNRPAPLAGDDLENARTVVVGGAGLGSMENFGQVRQLAAAVAGQVAATRPPVLNHWVAENRLIGQTGKTVNPNLLFSVGT